MKGTREESKRRYEKLTGKPADTAPRREGSWAEESAEATAIRHRQEYEEAGGMTRHGGTPGAMRDHRKPSSNQGGKVR